MGTYALEIRNFSQDTDFDKRALTRINSQSQVLQDHIPA